MKEAKTSVFIGMQVMNLLLLLTVLLPNVSTNFYLSDWMYIVLIVLMLVNGSLYLWVRSKLEKIEADRNLKEVMRHIEESI
ncbi:hypothetical protein [Vagococcus hydrophili]|uniref:Uncharacterized protein n=1 Tax=Vagococcus hydrophili TaxID=2714947 RepID=A0A6G8ASW9_9ENTE|nr:hypothetical protein [Vagococcus hydrophili]QIL48087.1 hypothetical protein G7082_05955 [Vagococcus hydrophili]